MDQSDEQALHLYGLAADQFHPAALRSIGLLYWEGRAGLPKDGAVAKGYFAVAAEHGDSPSAEILARLKQELEERRYKKEEKMRKKMEKDGVNLKSVETVDFAFPSARWEKMEGMPPNMQPSTEDEELTEHEEL